jgi:hypothetical protein
LTKVDEVAKYDPEMIKDRSYGRTQKEIESLHKSGQIDKEEYENLIREIEENRAKAKAKYESDIQRRDQQLSERKLQEDVASKFKLNETVKKGRKNQVSTRARVVQYKFD